MPLYESDFTEALCRELVREHGTVRDAAKSLVGVGMSRQGKPLSYRRIEELISRHVGPRRLAREALRAAHTGKGIELSRPADPDRLNHIDELLDRKNIDLDAIGSIDNVRIKAWGVAAIDRETGKLVTEGLHSTDVTLRPRDPAFPVLQPAPPRQILYRDVPRISRQTRIAIVYSDSQCGYLWGVEPNDALEPIHDPAAFDMAEQITADIQPDEQDWIGDFTDWQHFSRWPKHQEMARTLQPSIDVSGWRLARLCAAASVRSRAVKRVMIGSNHGDRPERSMLAYNMEAVGMKRAAYIRQPEEWPVHSEAYLLGFNDLGIEYSGRYPGGEYYLLPDLVLTHAPAKRLEFAASNIHGHLHRLTRSTMVQHGFSGRQTYFQYDIGCMCQVGVTEDKRRLMVTRVPSDRGRCDWAQGIAVVEIVEPHGSLPAFHAVEQIAFHAGQAAFRGKVYSARPECWDESEARSEAA